MTTNNQCCQILVETKFTHICKKLWCKKRRERKSISLSIEI